jgi:hypothetical protein
LTEDKKLGSENMHPLPTPEDINRSGTSPGLPVMHMPTPHQFAGFETFTA